MKSRNILKELRDFALLMVLGAGIAWFGLDCTTCKESTRELIVMGSFTAVLWILLWKGNEYLGEWISVHISWIEFPLRRFIVGMLVTIAYTFFAMFALTSIYKKSLTAEVNVGVVGSVVITIGISLFMHGREFLFNWKRAVLEADRYQKESIEAKYTSLKNQVNPHFLFNSLNALSNLVYEDEAKALVFINELSDVYRYVIETQDMGTVPLHEELRFLESYLYLQQIRFGDNLRVSFGLQGLRCNVAPLALQMLIENAIKHNVISGEDPLIISVRSEGNFIVVENNLQKKLSMAGDSAGVGLENIRKRYEMLHAPDVEIEEHDGHFRVKLPVLLN